MGTSYVILFSNIGTKWDEVGTKLVRSWNEVGTKFDDCGTKLVEFSTKYNPEVIKYRPL